MRAFWIYKCNNKNEEYQRTWGDWAEVFDSTKAKGWGSTSIVAELAQAKIRDMVIAYQTDRNELVGVARVVGWRPQGRYKRLVVKPIRRIGVRVRPLKESNAKVARIPALQPGRIGTLYSVSRADAHTLLRAAGLRLAENANEPSDNAERSVQGAGFGTPERNKLVEREAVRHIKRHFRRQGWSVTDVSSENRGYDLLCKRPGERSHVEVKGARGEGQQFILTARELDTWTKDKQFVLAFVGSALSAKPSLSFFPSAAAQREFELRPLSFIARRQPNPDIQTSARKSRRHRNGASSAG
ncbi:MAG: DUF3883 domain-containing protein [Betaproteobacteria bacterium]|nr:MAG: DUF3883 domain-containing protein [Betaproteobacteria bacterium]